MRHRAADYQVHMGRQCRSAADLMVTALVDLPTQLVTVWRFALLVLMSLLVYLAMAGRMRMVPGTIAGAGVLLTMAPGVVPLHMLATQVALVLLLFEGLALIM